MSSLSSKAIFQAQGLRSGLGRGLGSKFILVAILSLLSLIPLWTVREVVKEREDLNEEVKSDIAHGWGGPQQLEGPRLVVPYVQTFKKLLDNKTVMERRTRYLVITPGKLNIDVDLTTEMRQRSIYKTTVYLANISIRGHFQEPKESEFEGKDIEILWQQAYLSTGISDPRGIRKAEITWNEKPRTVKTGAGSAQRRGNGLSAQVSLKKGPTTQHEFSIDILLAGSQWLGLEPVGMNNHFNIVADWNSPSFKGSFLPTEQAVDSGGFSSAWDIQHLATGIPHHQTMYKGQALVPTGQSAEVHLFEPQNLYRQVDRATKYGLLFIALTFLTLFVFEASMGQRIHFVQYLLVGLALSLFFLILISYAEYLGFDAAYTVSSTIVIGMNAAYSASILKNYRYALLVGSIQLALFGTIYILLNSEDTGLMSGSIMLAIALSATMYFTRNISWYREDSPVPEPKKEPQIV